MAKETRFAHLIHLAQRSLFRAVDRSLRARLDIGSAQLGVLYYLHEHPGCTLGALSRGLMLNNSAITGVVGRMREAGLVERQPLPNDRRTARVVLTDRGRAVVQDATPLLNHFNETIRHDFTEAELDYLEARA